MYTTSFTHGPDGDLYRCVTLDMQAIIEVFILGLNLGSLDPRMIKGVLEHSREMGSDSFRNGLKAATDVLLSTLIDTEEKLGRIGQ